MPWQEFLAHRLGIGDWPPTSEDAARVIPPEAWHPLADPVSKIKSGHTFALDIDPGQAWATLSAAGVRDDGLYHVGVVEHCRGTGWIVDSCREWLDRFPDAPVVVDPRADLGALLTRLEDAGIILIRLSAGEYKDACGGFLQAVMDKQLRYQPPQPELGAAVAGAKTKPLLDAWKWDRSSGALITPLISCTNALWGTRTQSPPQVWSLTEAAERLQAKNPEAAGSRFVPVDQFSGHRGLFRP